MQSPFHRLYALYIDLFARCKLHEPQTLRSLLSVFLMADALVNVLNGVRGGLSDVLRNIQSTLQPKASSHHPGDEHTKTMTDGLQTDTSSRESRAIAIEAVSAAPLLAGQQHVSIGPVTREDLGRSTWLLLHTLAAQYPSRPSRQQRKDVAALVAITPMFVCEAFACFGIAAWVSLHACNRWTH